MPPSQPSAKRREFGFWWMETAVQAHATKALWSVDLSWERASRLQSMGSSYGLLFQVPQGLPRGAQNPLESLCQHQPLTSAQCSLAARSCSCLLPPLLRVGATASEKTGLESGGIPSWGRQLLLEQSEPSRHGMVGSDFWRPPEPPPPRACAMALRESSLLLNITF